MWIKWKDSRYFRHLLLLVLKIARNKKLKCWSKIRLTNTTRHSVRLSDECQLKTNDHYPFFRRFPLQRFSTLSPKRLDVVCEIPPIICLSQTAPTPNLTNRRLLERGRNFRLCGFRPDHKIACCSRWCLNLFKLQFTFFFLVHY
jgi:hypothetical protein